MTELALIHKTSSACGFVGLKTKYNIFKEKEKSSICPVAKINGKVGEVRIKESCVNLVQVAWEEKNNLIIRMERKNYNSTTFSSLKFAKRNWSKHSKRKIKK